MMIYMSDNISKITTKSPKSSKIQKRIFDIITHAATGFISKPVLKRRKKLKYTKSFQSHCFNLFQLECNNLSRNI